MIGHRNLAVVAGGSSAAAPRVLDAVEADGHQPCDVRWIVLPSLSQWWSIPALLAACPNATVLAHPRACRHLSAPQKLVHAELAAYGSAGFQALHGCDAEAYLQTPVPREQVRPVAAAEDLPWPTPNGEEPALAEAGWSASFLHGHGHSTDGELCFVLVRSHHSQAHVQQIHRLMSKCDTLRFSEPRHQRWPARIRWQLPWGRLSPLGRPKRTSVRPALLPAVWV